MRTKVIIPLLAMCFIFQDADAQISTHMEVDGDSKLNGITDIKARDTWQLKIINDTTGGGTWRFGASADHWNAGGGKLLIGTSTNSTSSFLSVDDLGRFGIGTVNPTHKFHLSGFSSNGHLAMIENKSTTTNADGLLIKLGAPVTEPSNNFITFEDGDGVAGRIEGFGTAFAPFPPINFSDYYSPIAINSAFTPGTLPSLDFSSASWPTLNSGSLGTFSLDLDFDVGLFVGAVGCATNPLCPNTDIDPFYSGTVGLTGFSFPTINQGSWPTFSEGSLPQFDFDVLIDPTPLSTALTDLKTVMCWALENGERSLITTNPWDVKLMQDVNYLKTLAECKSGGVTYGSGGADYAEYLKRENPSEKMQAGQIVGIRGGEISLDTEDAEQLMVISMMPIVLGNLPAKEEDIDLYEKVAFLGQAPTFVVGQVKSGDYIIPSGKNDGYGLAVSPSDLRLEHVSQIVGRAWEDGDEPVNFVNMVVGLKTGEMAKILQLFQEDYSKLDKRLSQIEARLDLNN